MDEYLLNSVYNLKKSLENDERVKKLNLLEKEMMEDEEVMKLSYLKDVMNEKYNDMKRFFDDESNEVKTALKNFYEAKKELESHPKVRAYLKQYQEVRMLYDDVNNILFNDLNSDLWKK